MESIELKQRTLRVLEQCNTEAIGTLSKREVMRALSSLGSKPYLKELLSDTSATGKGRPQYALDCAPSDIIETMSDDERLSNVAKQYW